MLLQRRPNFGARPVEQDALVPLRDPERLADLLGGPAEHVPERDHFALVHRQEGDGGLDDAERFLVEDLILGPGGGRLGPVPRPAWMIGRQEAARGDRRLVILRGSHRREGRAARLAYSARSGAVRDDAENPAPQRGAALERGQSLQDPEPRLLHHFFRYGAARDVDGSDPQHGRVQRLDEGQERLLVSGPQGGEDPCVLCAGLRGALNVHLPFPAETLSQRTHMTAEEQRLVEAREHRRHWKRWGPYLSERAWGTVREDYSKDGNAWDYFPHDHARSRAYRWNEDGIAGICDRHQYLCFALAMWNGRDPFLKERMFGVSGKEGNHGEDVKEYYFYLDNTPTHSYMKYLYKYPQAEFPYAQLVKENERRTRQDAEYELADTGIFGENRYFDVEIEYAKHEPEDLLIR